MSARLAYLLSLGALLAVLALAGAAEAREIRVGNIVFTAEGSFTPTRLPKHENAPISLQGGGEISTVNGEYPPVLEDLNFEFDRHGALDTHGLAVCTKRRLEATTVADARANCPGAIVGEGHARAVVLLPESRPIDVSTPLTLFNGPRKGGDPTLFAHAYVTVPAPTTFVVPIVIETIHKGAYGYRTKAKIPRIAGGYGIPIAGHLKIGRTWTDKGHKHSYLGARCETGHLQARVEATFKDGSFVSGVFLKPCRVRR